MSPDAVTVDAWYQLAVLRTYGPWLSAKLPVPDEERKQATDRVQHARLVLSIHDEQSPQLPPPPVVAFNQRKTP
ncbi:hypothetical protein [Actinomadura decatromicini]|uniref:Uncharacterized protein n=1 Tax=Actinomadura decatromicini TaxID=2604572 RepID=A0A5D3FWV6_9ACTN|nr:hypothetical protein [Actinomadura decatromicini]TYK52386.1 hypothetical protein FXF68_00920 [Actinomadura decatromicini]